MRLAPFLFVLAASAASAEDWQTIVEGPPYMVKNRARDGTAIKEVWAEGDLEAQVQDIQSTLMTPSNFHKFMPNLKVSREIGKPESDGSIFVYTQLDLPVVQSRDYIVQVWVDEGVKADGSGAFRQHWKAVPDKIPSRANLIRVRVNDGSWDITPIGDGSKSHVVYKFATDPGGWIPAFAADMGNKQAVTETLRAVEKEAQRRGGERKKAAADAGSAAPK